MALLLAKQAQCENLPTIASSPMRLIREGQVRERQAILASFSLLLLLSGCGEAEQVAEQVAEHECRSLDARSSVSGFCSQKLEFA